jgi:HEAT repeat protein
MLWWTVRKLKSRNPAKRLEAVESLKLSNDPRAAAFIQRMLADHDPVVRRSTVSHVLANSPGTASDLLRARDPDLRRSVASHLLANNPDAAIRLASIQELRRLGSFDALQSVSDSDNDIRFEAAEYLLKQIEPQAKTSDDGVRVRAFRSLKSSRDVRILALMDSCLDSRSLALRREAAEYLLEGGGERTRLLTWLEKEAGSKDPQHHTWAKKTIALVPEPEAAKIFLKLATREEICAIRSAGSVEPMIEAIRNGSNQSFELSEALGEIGDVRAIRPLIELLFSEIGGDWHRLRARQSAARALRKLRAQPATTREAVFIAVYTGDFKSAVDSGQAAIEPLVELVRDERMGGRPVDDAAIEALGVVGDDRAVEPLLCAL